MANRLLNAPSHLLGRCLTSTFLAISLTLGTTTLPSAQTHAAEVTADQLADIAVTGNFDQLLILLQQGANLPRQQTQPLIDAIRRYQSNESIRDSERREEFVTYIGELQEHMDEGDLEDALRSAIEAHGVADDPMDFLATPMIKQLVDQAATQAKQAEADHNWYQAQILYGRLDLLFEDTRAYKDDLKRAVKHMRVVQIYAPDELKKMQRERLISRGEDLEDLSKAESDPWQERLKQVKLAMLQQTMQQAVAQHVNRPSYNQLVDGALDAMMIFVDTPNLAVTFPSVGDADARNRFRDFMVALQESLRNETGNISREKSDQYISRVLSMNKLTLALPERVLVYEMAEGVTGTLDDFTAVIWPQEVEDFQRKTQGTFTGVGIQILKRDSRLRVVSPLPNTPAQRAGIIADDVIAKVDGKSTDTWSLQKAVNEITGPKGTPVTLTIDRSGEMLDFTLYRDIIEIESIKGWSHSPRGDWDYWLDRSNGIGYVRLVQFIPQTVDDLDNAVASMQAQGDLNGLILDLRFNPGGLLPSAVDVSDRFIRRGDLVSTVDSNGRRTQRYMAHRHRLYDDFPVVVLINRGSASASEIVSGALQAHGRATVLGERSYGKGSVQDIMLLSHREAALKLTTQHYMLPNNQIIHRDPGDTEWGIEPDLSVPMTESQTIDSIGLRQAVDLILDGDQTTFASEDKPWAAEPFRVPNGEVKETTLGGKDITEVEIRQPTADMILSLGVDPQIEAALIVVKAQLLAENPALAKGQ